MKILMISLIMMIGSGCSALVAEPLCLPSRPTLINLDNDQKLALVRADREAVEALAINDARLKNHIESIEDITEAHNGQFRAKCAD